MSHLSLETIARIVDEGPSVEETRHLDACRICRSELEGMREDVYGLSMLPDVSPAPDQWASLERRLVDEGLIRQPQPAGFTWGRRHMLQAAAALVLFVGGTATGRLTAGGQALPMAQAEPSNVINATSPSAANPSVETMLAADAPAAGRSDGQASYGTPESATPQARRPVTLASTAATYEPQSVEEAAAVLQELDRLYLAALTRYAEMTSGAQQGDPVARLAALQSIVLTTQAALAEAPADPVLNGVHLTAMAQRDATLRQVAANSAGRWY